MNRMPTDFASAVLGLVLTLAAGWLAFAVGEQLVGAVGAALLGGLVFTIMAVATAVPENLNHARRTYFEEDA